MSLINKMLQDLDERQPSSPITNDFFAAVKPVEIRSRAYWLSRIIGVLGLTLILVAAWWVFHRSGTHRDSISPQRDVIPQAVQQAQFPLKLDMQLSLNLQPQAVTSASDNSSADSAVGDLHSAAISRDDDVNSAPYLKNVDETRPEKIASVREPSTASMPTRRSAAPIDSSVDMSALGAASHSTQSRSMTLASTQSTELKPSATLTKQVRELSSHDKAENNYRNAANLIQQARLNEAVAVLEQALVFDPRHVGARQALIGVLLDLKRAPEALRQAQAGLALDPTQVGLAMIAARLQLDKGELQAAIETLQHTLPSGAERGDYQSFLAALLQRAGNHKEAIAHYLVALRSAPQNGVWWMGLGISLQAEQRKADARDAFIHAKLDDSLSPELKAFIDQRLAQLGS